jgi:hypothetical protein
MGEASGRGVVTYVVWSLFTCAAGVVQALIAQDRLILRNNEKVNEKERI